ncbi:hypothetical protein N8I77_003910 [Diaporthe amygdali]|uniref:Zn(2)-C6 fungal-type domain-containing protein n=1 Tax=Phomopsis amygdali TaxID=1214568 RepID=A0AAD9SJV3_PHOAM|nr:hypothetical protein N8I77_003910 [Diaporthe amygdali]
MEPLLPNTEGQVVPDEIQTFIEQWHSDEIDLFQQFCQIPNEDPPAYVQPSVDGRDDTSTYLGSESHAPPLTFGQTLSPTSHSRASPSSPSRPEDADPQTTLSAVWAGEDLGDLNSADCLRHIGEGIGEAPEILIQRPTSPSPIRLQEDDVSIHLSPWNPSLPVTPVSPPAQAVPMKRGRSNPLPGKKRAKVSNMRKIGACTRCHIRKRECNESVPCDHCRKAFPRNPEVCVREKLSDVRFPDGGQGASIWIRDSTGALLSRQNRQLVAIPIPVVVTFNQASDSPGFALMLQEYVVNERPFMSATSYFPSPAPAGFASAPVSHSSDRLETQSSPNSVPWLCLAPGHEPLSGTLLTWAERQLSKELDVKKAPDFEAAILSFLLAYRDSPMDLSDVSYNIGKKSSAFVDAKNLIRKTCEMRCWYRIWQTSALYYQADGGGSATGNNIHQPMPVAALFELKKIAANALIACEKHILSELDEWPPGVDRLTELPLWACLWQMILIYKQLVAGYSNLARSHPVNSIYGVNPGFNEVSALSVVQHLYRLLIVKYNAYFGSTSPIYPRKGQPSTSELLAGDKHLKREWDNVLMRRKEFYVTISGGVASDASLRTLIVDAENVLEHRSRRRAR